jgi:NADH:ubiquinone oxidoreductase subunit 3 (subunit A)
MTSLAAYLLLFVAVGVGFIFVHLVAGKLIRPSKPDAEKKTIYECGEPTIGSAWIQFDVRFYVVALLFVIFDVEVAFFFPWAEVFGKANNLTGTEKPVTAAEYRAYAEKILDLAVPATSSDQQSRDLIRFEAIVGHTVDGTPLLDPEGRPTTQAIAERLAELKRTLPASEILVESYPAGLTDERLKKLVDAQAAAHARPAQERTNDEAKLTLMVGPLRQTEFDEFRAEARSLARTALFEVLVFFGVLLVGFAYLWRRGDLAWVRSTAAEAEAERARPPVSKTTTVTEPKEVAAV